MSQIYKPFQGGGPSTELETLTTQDGHVVPPTNHNINVSGGTAAAGTHPVATVGNIGTSTVTTNVQLSQAIDSADATKVGLANFNSADFTVDSNGFVSAIDTGTITSVTTSNATPQFALTGTTENVNFQLTNLVLGSSAASITSAVENVGIGSQCLNALTSGTGNVAVGFQSLLTNTTGGGNTAVGLQCLKLAVSSSGNTCIGQNVMSSYLGTGTTNNTGVGDGCLQNLGTGAANTCLGKGAGSAYTTSESSNIIIGNSGVITESNVIRIGTQGSGSGQQNLAFIAGITGATPTSGNHPQVTLCDNAGNLTPSTSGTSGQLFQSGGTATPGWTTATYPASSGGTGKILRDNGTNFVETTATYPDTATTGDILIATGSNVIGSLADVATGSVLVSGGNSTAPSYSATPTVTSITFGSGTALSQYAEGTFTPTVQGVSAGGATTYTTQTGFYTRIGRLIFINIHLTWTAATGTGVIKIGGLPFTVSSSAQTFQSCSNWLCGGGNFLIATATSIHFGFSANQTYLLAYGHVDNTGALVNSSLASNQAVTDLYIGGFYEV